MKMHKVTSNIFYLVLGTVKLKKVQLNFGLQLLMCGITAQLQMWPCAL